MQVDVKNIFNNVFLVVIFRELCDEGAFGKHSPLTMLFYGVHSSLYY